MNNLEETHKIKGEENPLSWHFPNLDHGDVEGFSDPLLEYFEGNHEWFIARETIQNSLDARPNYDNPVKIVFEKIEIHKKYVPGIDELKLRIKSCLEQILEIEATDEKAKSYFTRALEILGQDYISILKIGDYNTLGLDGLDDDKNGRWFRLVQSVGVNKMTGAGGGSFGIGKGAPIAASQIRTVLYSTFNGIDRIFQGKTRLITHKFNEHEYRGTGSFGIDGYISVRDISLIPEKFSRNERGTDVYIIGYDFKREDWRQELAKSILENFWFAIYSGDLIISLIDEINEVKIEEGTLYENLNKYSPDDAFVYFMAVKKPDRKEERPLETLGNCKLFIRKAEFYPKTISFMRKPKMLVEKRKFRTLHDNFAGVFLCDDDKGNLILRDMEPPDHNKWDWDRHADRKLSKKADKEINDWIRDTLREMDNVDKGEPEDIPELDRFLPYEDEAVLSNGNTNMQYYSDPFLEESSEEVGAERNETEDEVEDFIQRPHIVKRTSGDEGGSSGARGEGVGGKVGKGSGTGKGDSVTLINTTDLRFRIISLKKNNKIEYCLIINSLSDQKGAINIVGVGDDANYPIPIAYAKSWDEKMQYNTSSSYITNLELHKGEKQKIRIGLSSNKKYALGLENYEG